MLVYYISVIDRFRLDAFVHFEHCSRPCPCGDETNAEHKPGTHQPSQTPAPTPAPWQAPPAAGPRSLAASRFRALYADERSEAALRPSEQHEVPASPIYIYIIQGWSSSLPGSFLISLSL